MILNKYFCSIHRLSDVFPRLRTKIVELSQRKARREEKTFVVRQSGCLPSSSTASSSSSSSILLELRGGHPRDQTKTTNKTEESQRGDQTLNRLAFGDFNDSFTLDFCLGATSLSEVMRESTKFLGEKDRILAMTGRSTAQRKPFVFQTGRNCQTISRSRKIRIRVAPPASMDLPR